MENKQYNPLEYVRWRGDLTFEQSEINAVDVFLCTQLASPDYTKILPKGVHNVTIDKAAKQYFNEHVGKKKTGILQSNYLLPTFQAMSKSERFKNAVLCEYENILSLKDEEQFSAVTIKLIDDLLVVSYRGTDDTLVGWKEDCYLAASDEVPAQRDAVEYLERVASRHSGTIVTVGHSKGGNLAIYAAAKASKEIRDRILYAFSFDGPGFRDEFLASEGYQDIKDRTYTILSQNAIVGMLLKPAGERVVVHTDTEGPMAHDGFNWYVQGPRFQEEKSLSRFSKATERVINKTLAKLTDAEKKEFVDDLFEALESTGAVTLTELVENMNISQAFAAMKMLRKSKPVRDFVSAVKKSIKEKK